MMDQSAHAPQFWTVDQVCAWGKSKNLPSDVISSIQSLQLNGERLSQLNDDDVLALSNDPEVLEMINNDICW